MLGASPQPALSQRRLTAGHGDVFCVHGADTHKALSADGRVESVAGDASVGIVETCHAFDSHPARA